MIQGPKFLVLLSLPVAAGCGLLAGPVSDATNAAFDVPLIDDAKFSGNRITPLESEHSLSPEANVTTLPASADTKIWGPVVNLHVGALAANQPGVFRIEVTDFQLDTAEPLVINVAPSSRDGLVWGLKPAATPRDPRACHFRLDPSSTGDELGRRLEMCVEDWVRANGVPNVLEMTVTAGGELPDGQKGLNAGDFNVSWKQKLYTEKELEASCKVVTMDPDVAANGDTLDLTTAVVSGWGYSNVDVYLSSFAIVVDGQGVPTALAILNKEIAGGTSYWIIARSDGAPFDPSTYVPAGNIQPLLSPGMPRFPMSVVDGLAGTGGHEPGKAIACWSVYGSAPREGGIGITVSGEASLRGLSLENGK